MEKNKNAIINPCGHYCACFECLLGIADKYEDNMKCPICRENLDSTFVVEPPQTESK
jgi:hypothetical protein